MSINIYKKEYENDFSITIQEYNYEKNKTVEIDLYKKLKELEFTKEQAEFLHNLFHKVVNREIIYR